MFIHYCLPHCLSFRLLSLCEPSVWMNCLCSLLTVLSSVHRKHGEHHLCRQGKPQSPWTHPEGTAAAPVCTWYVLCSTTWWLNKLWTVQIRFYSNILFYHFPPENLLKTPKHAKKLLTPVQSARKALGAVNKISGTPAVSRHEMKPQKTQVRTITRNVVNQWICSV